MAKAWKEYNRIPKGTATQIPELNGLSGSEWAQRSKSINLYNGPIANKRKLHGAAFPITLAKHLIEIYTAKGDLVLDPFMGVGTTLDAAQLLGRHGVGFDTNKKFVSLAKQGIDPIDMGNVKVAITTSRIIHHDNCRKMLDYVDGDTVDFILTSPPYSDLLNKTVKNFGGSDYKKNIYVDSKRELAKPYSKDKEDFGNMNWEEYCDSVLQLMKDLHYVAKPGTFNAWVVRDFRDMPEGIPYVNLHGKIAELGAKAGWILTDIVIWDQSNQRHLVKLGGQKSRRFYFNIGHSYIVIFRKNIDKERFQNAK